MSAENVKVNIPMNKCCVWEEGREILLIIVATEKLSDLWSKMNSNSLFSFCDSLLLLSGLNLEAVFVKCH